MTMNFNKKINWDELEHRYVTGTESYKTIAESKGIKTARLGAYAKTNSWTDKRKKYRRELLDKANQATLDLSLRNIRKIESVTSNAINNIAEYFRRGNMFFRPHEFKQLTGALKDISSIISQLRDLRSDDSDTDENSIKVILPEEFDLSEYGN